MKKINKFWKLFNKDSNHKTVTEENSETPQATTESPPSLPKRKKQNIVKIRKIQKMPI